MADREDIENQKRKLREITGRKDLIPGIYNYCDRWCARCSFVSRCSVGLTEQEIRSPEHDLQNMKFWEHMSLIFQATLEMITEAAHESGIDLPDDTTAVEKPVHHHTVAETIAKEYGIRLLAWLEYNQDLLGEKAKNFALINENEVVTFHNALEVINWYSLFIAVKINRASGSSHSDDEAGTDWQDNNGSAKIAMIAVNRSLEAFSFLYHQLPELEDDILKFLTELTQIQKLLNVAFPFAMRFKRPGFDDNNQD